MRNSMVKATLVRFELINESTWSSYLSYLILTGIPLLLALPTTARVESLVEPRLSFLPVFTIVAALLFLIYCLNFGLLHTKTNKPLPQIKISLFAHVIFLLLVSLPYWTVFQGISYVAAWRVFGALVYLTLYGLCWAVLGSVIGLRWRSEIAQFNLKYALLALSILTTFFILRPLNPFLILSLWFGEGSLNGQWGFLLTGYGSLVVLGLMLFIWMSTVFMRYQQSTERGSA